MICPVLSAARMICTFLGYNLKEFMSAGESLEECNEDKCAWWDTWLEDCGIMGINRELAKIVDALNDK